MNKEKDDFFLHSNEVNHINREDYVTIALYRYHAITAIGTACIATLGTDTALSSQLSQDNHKTLVLM